MSTGLFKDEEQSYNIEETKYKLKVDAPSTDSSFGAAEPTADAGAENFAPEDGGLSDFEDAAPEEGNADKPFDDEPFDAGVEADEDTDPKKYIQQLSGKLGQSLRQYTETEGQPDFDLEKFAVNSVLSATHTSEMDKGDQKDIINKVKGAGKDDATDSGDGDMELDSEESVDDGGEEDLDFGDETVEEIVEELPLSDTDASVDVLSPEMSGMITGCEPKAPIDANAVDALKDIAKLKESKKISTFVDKAKLIKELRLMESVEPMTQPITKPDVAPVRPMRETDRPFLPKRKDKVNPKPKADVNEGGVTSVEFDGKQVNVGSLKIEGVDRRDYPDFTDAFFSYGEYTDGMEMSDIELEKFNLANLELMNQLIFDRQLYM